jgi:hypothetical protein
MGVSGSAQQRKRSAEGEALPKIAERNTASQARRESVYRGS